MPESIYPSRDATGLLVIDVQERLLAAMPEHTARGLLKAHTALLELAQIFALPVVYTEQYPQGLGPTVAPLLERLDAARRIEKIEFSACQNDTFRTEVLETLPSDIVLTGLEAHVCVLQTAADLVLAGRRVFVPHDAVCSRREDNRSNALALLGRCGAVVTNTESIVFHHLGKAGGEDFKRLSRLVK